MERTRIINATITFIDKDIQDVKKNEEVIKNLIRANLKKKLNADDIQINFVKEFLRDEDDRDGENQRDNGSLSNVG